MEQEPLAVEGCHAARAGGGDGLAVAGILHVARGEDALDRGARRARLDADIPLVVELQLSGGAEVDARTAGHADSLTPLEMTIRQQRLPLLPLYEVCVLLLDAGAEMTPRCRQWVVKELERFQRNRPCIKNLEFLAQQVEGMELNMLSFYYFNVKYFTKISHCVTMDSSFCLFFNIFMW